MFALSMLRAQKIDSLQYSSLLSDLNKISETQKSIEIDEIKGVYKLTIWHFVPNLNYDFINNNYYVTISTSNFITNMLNKRQERRRISAIERRYEAKTKIDQIELKSHIVAVNQKLDNLKASGIILDNDIELYKIKVQENTANEIDTETFLKEKSAILNKIKTHNIIISEIQKEIFEIEKLIVVEIEIDLHSFYVPLETVLNL
jgi:hypothetical protein